MDISDDDDEFYDDEDDETIEDDFLNAILPPPQLLIDQAQQQQLLDDPQQQQQSTILNDEQQIIDEQNCVADYSFDKFTRQLLDKAGSGDLNTILNAHLAKYVPIMYKAQENPLKNLIEDKENIENILLKPLESFILDKVADMNSLKQSKTPQLCGKVFKAGEPTYSCRDCGTDPTCVLCWLCFKNSGHRLHKYKMMTSMGGGGYCDCGDVEAWKQQPFCELHSPAASASSNPIESEDLSSQLPSDLAQRTRQLFEYLFDYIIEVLILPADSQAETLPAHLQSPLHGADTYVCFLYNDEQHSYDQVVSMLKKSIGCDDKRATDYATVVDKEGRSVIRRARQVDCTRVKDIANTCMTPAHATVPPLKTVVMHTTLAAHQYFAETLIKWLQQFTSNLHGLKEILREIGFAQNTKQTWCVMEKFMLADCVLWKSARATLHQYYISIYFMDTNWKRQFGVMYTRNYQTVWRSYVSNADDTVSITDLSVQLFTVISLAKHLIENENLFEILAQTLNEHARTKLSATTHKLVFDRRNRQNLVFKRAQHTIYDIKYTLISPPDQWTDRLRTMFLNGFKQFILFLKYMQGMDAVKRQTDQHIEYEPEWETGFNLLIKLQKPIESLIDWCVSDMHVLNECVRLLVESLKDEHKYSQIQGKLFKHECQMIDNDITKENVSIHAPLTRLLTALCIESQKICPDPNRNESLRIVESNMKMIEFMEPSLSSLVLVSQTNSGLWRRNGYSLLSQVYFYTNIKCRMEMYDRDLQALQIAASQMNPNDFLINLLAKFKLLDYWKKDNPEGKAEELKLEYLNQSAQDFLHILITILSERYDMCKPSDKGCRYDKLKNEIIHQLCIQPSTSHSDLVKNVFADSNEVTRSHNDLEIILKEIANFKNSNDSTKKGTYELKSVLYADYNPYFYHYSKIEKTKSEDEVLKKTQGKQYHIPPANRQPFLPQYMKIRSILDSDVLIQILYKIIERNHNKTAQKSATAKAAVTDGQLLSALYLIAMALNEEKQKSFYPATATPVPFMFIEKLAKLKYNENLRNFLTSIEINGDYYKDLYAYILNTLFEGSVPATSSQATIKADESKNKEKNLLAEKRRNKILAKMNAAQTKFISNNKDYFEQPLDDVANKSDENMMDCSQSSSEEQEHQIVCLGPTRTTSTSTQATTSSAAAANNQIISNVYRCILCQEDEEIKINSEKQMVLCSYVQHSKVLTAERTKNPPNETETNDKDNKIPFFMSNQRLWGIHTTSCGHVMHSTCWQKYVDGIRSHDHRRNGRFINISTKRNEFLCPLCETIGNTVLPVIPTVQQQSQTNGTPAEQFEIINSSRWNIFLDNIIEMTPAPADDNNKIEMPDMVRALGLNDNDLFSKQQQIDECKLNEDILNIYDIYARSLLVFGMIQLPDDTDPRMIESIFTNCSYVIESLEQSLRNDMKPLSQQLPLGQLNLLKNLANYSVYYTMNSQRNFDSHLKSYFLNVLKSILPIDENSNNLMDRDLFHVLVTVCYLFRYAYPHLNEQFIYFYMFNYLFKLHCVQVVLNLILFIDNQTGDNQAAASAQKQQKNDFEYLMSSLDNCTTDDEMSAVYNFYLFISSNLKRNKTNEFTKETLTRVFKQSLMPFLRCSFLFFQHLTNIQPLQTTIENETFDYYCKYLGLYSSGGSLCETVDIDKDVSIQKTIKIWCNSMNDEKLKCLVKYPKSVSQLIELPYDFVDLINNYANISTITAMDTQSDGSANHDSSTSLILCLVCGEFLRSQQYGGQTDLIGTTHVGTCTAHAYKCSRTSGMFLRISECQILLLHLNLNAAKEIHVMGSFVPAPYLDDYGETDQGLRRGNPLRFCAQRYKKLHKLWLNHSISDEVYRLHQNNQSIISNVDWILL